MRKFFAALLVIWMVIASVVLMAGCPKSPESSNPETYRLTDETTAPAEDPGSAPPPSDPGMGGSGGDDDFDDGD